MSIWGFDSARPRRRLLLTVGAAALLLGPTVATLEHPAHEIGHATRIHAAATHPDAGQHFDPEDYSSYEGCLACWHGVRTLGELDGGAEPLVARGSFLAPGVQVEVEGLFAPTGQSRAPPA